MAKSKEKKPKPKPPEGVKSVVEIKKTIDDRKTKLTKAKDAAKKDGKFNKLDPKYRTALKRLKRAQRKLAKEGHRLKPKGTPKVAEAAAAAPAEAAAPATDAAAAAAPAEEKK
jgi:hypothetical protein